MQGLLFFVKKAFYCWLAATSIIWNDASSKDSINRSYLSYSYTWYQIKKVFLKNVQWLIVNLLKNLSSVLHRKFSNYTRIKCNCQEIICFKNIFIIQMSILFVLLLGWFKVYQWFYQPLLSPIFSALNVCCQTVRAMAIATLFF